METQGTNYGLLDLQTFPGAPEKEIFDELKIRLRVEPKFQDLLKKSREGLLEKQKNRTTFYFRIEGGDWTCAVNVGPLNAHLFVSDHPQGIHERLRRLYKGMLCYSLNLMEGTESSPRFEEFDEREECSYHSINLEDYAREA